MIASILLASALSIVGNIHTPNGHGVANIPVSNGDTIVITDKKGNYSLPVIEDMNIFPILDGNWEMANKSKVRNADFPAFAINSDNHKSFDFTIRRSKPLKDFTINVIGDVQVSDFQEVDYASRTLWPELMVDSIANFNLWLGDIVNNNLTLYPQMRAMMDLLPSSSWTMVGNHDRDVDDVRTRQTASFSREFGAPTYAFTQGNVTFIVLNNVYGDGARSYTGKLDDRQLRFVKNLLKITPPDRRIVLSAHIPFAYMKNRNELLDLLKGRGDVLALTGHMHAVDRNFLKGDGVTVHELIAGASCGFWWVGERDWEGIPSALMQCGTPKGYFRMKFTPKDYEFSYKPTSQDASRQGSIWIADIDTIQRHIPDLQDYKRGDVLVTVYGGCDSTLVMATLDNGVRLEAVKEKGMDPNVARIREMNLSKNYPSKYSRKNPFRRTASPQLWRLTLPTEYQQGVHRIDITASDRYGLRSRFSRTYAFPPN